MLVQAISGRNSSTNADTRNFRYEVVGLQQNPETDKMDHAIRSSASVFFTVPFNRMNEAMQRITRMGGKIVSIQPLTLESSSSAAASDN